MPSAQIVGYRSVGRIAASKRAIASFFHISIPTGSCAKQIRRAVKVIFLSFYLLQDVRMVEQQMLVHGSSSSDGRGTCRESMVNPVINKI